MNTNKFKRDPRTGLMIKKPMSPLVMVDGKAAPICTAETKTYGNIWTRHLKLKKGQAKAGHKHEFDHLHFLAKGEVEIRVYDKTREDEPILVKSFVAPSWIKVPKEHFHDIVALKASEGYCIQAIRNDNEEVVGSEYAYDQDWIDEVAAYEAENGQKDETKK